MRLFLAVFVGCCPIATVRAAAPSNAVVDGAQTSCYNNTGTITAPTSSQSFYGQEAQFSGNQPAYTLSADGKTVCDRNTSLTWMRGPNMTGNAPSKTDRIKFADIPAWVASVNAAHYGGFSDWRLPSLKEQYSLFDCRGTDPSSYVGTDTSVLTPFIDATAFKFAWGNTAAGERLVDQQYASSTTFILNPSESGYQKDFGVNFSDGRIKGYDLVDVKSGLAKTFYVQLVRGWTGYGANSFVNNNDGTITDTSSGLMWTRDDTGTAMTWQAALAMVQTKNAANYLGHNDWRMPNVKELQNIVNYANSPDYNGLPAINTTFFNCSQIINEAGQTDYPYYWTSSTHAGYSTNNTGGGQANYVAFGRALGWPATQTKWIDVHGTGAQRCDPKAGPPFTIGAVATKTTVVNGTTYTGYSFGPQGDAIRGLNYLRLVRAGYYSIVNSTVTPASSSVTANGTATCTVSVTLNNPEGNPVPGKAVALASNRGTSDTISPTSGQSNSLGMISFTVKSSTAGSSVFTATGDGVALTQTAAVTFISDYTAWSNGTFAKAFTDTAPTHDPDGDRLTNQQEYAFGLDPTTGTSNNPIRQQLDNRTGTFQYTRRANSGLSYTVEVSTDLSGWNAAACTELVAPPDFNGVQVVTVTVTNSLPGGTLFVRVKAR